MSDQQPGASRPGRFTQTAAEAFLESIQRRVYGSLGLSAEDCQARERIGQQSVLPARLHQKALELSAADFERYRSDLLAGLAHDESAPRPTRFERPHQYSIVRELKSAIEQALEALGFDLPVMPVVGTLPTRSLDPWMLRVPGAREVVIVLDGSLLTFANLLAKAVTQTLPPSCGSADSPMGTLRTGWEARLDSIGAGRARFTELMMATIDGNPGAAPAYLPGSHYEHLAAELCETIELFVLAREYARLSDGHHLRASVDRRTMFGETVEALRFTPAQEARADDVGLALALTAAIDHGSSASWSFWSIDMLLASLGILERARWAWPAIGGVRPVGPLPTWNDERRARLRGLVGRLSGGAQAVAAARALQPVMDCLERHLEAQLATRYASRATLH